MGSGNGFYSGAEFSLDSKCLIDPNLLLVGPKIGEGAHAKVYEGKYKNQNVAIKIVHRGETPEEMAKRDARFGREVEMLSRVQHKNLVKFIGACKEPVMVIVTELLLGGTLRKYLVNTRPRCLDMRVSVGFALDIARAMECLHSHGIIHRDLKPAAARRCLGGDGRNFPWSGKGWPKLGRVVRGVFAGNFCLPKHLMSCVVS